MVSRCTQPGDGSYKSYGAKGVQVCERWRTFANFLADMGERPEGCTIGRKNDQGNYEPGNVSWETKSQQTRYFERNPNSKLTKEQLDCVVSLVRPGRGSIPSYRQMAKDLGVSASAITASVRRNYT
jgi:hypothetical protein